MTIMLTPVQTLYVSVADKPVNPLLHSTVSRPDQLKSGFSTAPTIWMSSSALMAVGTQTMSQDVLTAKEALQLIDVLIVVIGFYSVKIAA
jgi:hypothetical protein